VGSDLARISFDPTRDYRSVVTQQGRVTLEADVNEQNTIASEALRLETIDVVGPAGTPDDGYRVSVNADGSLAVGRGTMYLGGWRLQLIKDVELAQQPDWLDRPVFDTKLPALIALLVTEQSISATEDQPLREVALGGPDTAARTRLMQHLVEIATSQQTCLDAAEELTKTLTEMGLALDPKTLALTFGASLTVGFFPPPPPPDPCCPPAQGGYLGADNQLVQVTVSSYDSTAGTGTLLWGWNNASFLYRATVLDPTADPPVLKLGQSPVDAQHTPQPGQVIEILRTTTVLGEAADQNYIAAQQGTVVTLGTGTIFDPATNQLTLPSGTVVPNDPRSLFVRLWQAEVPFTSGSLTQLDAVSGLSVTVAVAALPSGQLLARPFWQFAVRPNTPQQVYPQRYQEAAQPPDGPRQWLCDLAVVTPGDGAPVPHDCRKHFLPLTEVGSCVCCNLVLDPTGDWQNTLNDALTSDATALSICFQPGQFTVASKITVSGKTVKMMGAGQGTVLTGSTLEAVLEFDNCPDVCLSDLSVVAGTSGYSKATGTVGLQGAVTVRSCNQVDIERVFLTCADGDLRSASCLAIYNPVIPVDQPTQYNVRVLNSQFTVGHFQVGILMVNADRAQVEGNLIITPLQSRNLTLTNLTKFRATQSRLQKQLLNAMIITDTSAATKKAQARLLKKQKTEASVKAPPTASASLKAPAPTPPAPPPAPAPAGATEAAAAAPAAPSKAATTIGTTSAINLGTIGRAHVRATFGNVKLQFISSDKLSNAWTDALQSAGLTQTSSAGAVHNAVKKIVATIVSTPEKVAPAFSNYLAATLPQLFSTSSQGIVVGGDLANDVRIMNNTVDGTAQGIHVGLSDLKIHPHQPHILAQRVQICGNTVNVRLTPEVTGDRHGIFLGCATSAIINDNHIELTSYPNASQYIYAIKVAGFFGPRLLIERNCMLGAFTGGIQTVLDATWQPKNILWKACDNASSSANVISPFFRVTDNIP
jgi:Family of unknown function (DUF6519)